MTTISANSAEMVALLRDSLSPAMADLAKESIEKSRKEPGKTVQNQDIVEALVAARNDHSAKPQRKALAGQLIRAIGGAKTPSFTFEQAKEFLGTKFKDDYSVNVMKDFAARKKALGESVFTDGGAVVPPEFAQEIIEVLRSQVVVRALGARVVPMPHGTLTMPYGNQGTGASNVAENAAVTIQQPTFGQLSLLARKIMALVPISNDLLSDANPQADLFIQQDMVAALRLQEDINFLRGSGVQNNMKGLRFLAGTVFNSSNAAGGAGNSTVAEVIHDLVSCMSLVETNNILIQNGGWVFAPRTKYALMSLKDNQGNFYFKDEMATGKLWGHDYRDTTSMPINLNNVGSLSSKESEVCFADFDKVIIGDTEELSVTPYLGGAYYDTNSGTIISGISNDQTVVVGKTRSDINCRFRGAEVVWLQGVTWGA